MPRDRPAGAARGGRAARGELPASGTRPAPRDGRVGGSLHLADASCGHAEPGAGQRSGDSAESIDSLLRGWVSDALLRPLLLGSETTVAGEPRKRGCERRVGAVSADPTVGGGNGSTRERAGNFKEAGRGAPPGCPPRAPPQPGVPTPVRTPPSSACTYDHRPRVPSPPRCPDARGAISTRVGPGLSATETVRTAAQRGRPGS